MVEAARRDDPIPVPSKPQEIIIDMNCIGTDWPEYLAQYVVKYHTQVKTYSYTDESCIAQEAKLTLLNRLNNREVKLVLETCRKGNIDHPVLYIVGKEEQGTSFDIKLDEAVFNPFHEACINTLSQYNRRDLNVGYPSEKYRVIKKIESTVRELELEALLRP